MGESIYGPSYIYGYNMSVIYHTWHPESTMWEKSDLICYHTMRESVAMGDSLMTHIPINDNPSDLMTKVLAGQKRQNHVGDIL